MTPKPDSQDKVLLKELLTPGYRDRARERGRRRRSAWNLILIPLAICGVGASWYVSLRLVIVARDFLLPEHALTLQEFLRYDCQGISAILFTLAPFFSAIPVGLLLCNSAAWLVPPARRAFMREAEGVSHASFGDAQRDLFTFAKYLIPIGLAVSLVGALTLRCPR